MRIVFLGTSGGLPTPRRSLPSVAVLREGEMMLFDCGEGTQTQIMRKGLGFGRLSKILFRTFTATTFPGSWAADDAHASGPRRRLSIFMGLRNCRLFFDSLVRDINLRTKFP